MKISILFYVLFIGFIEKFCFCSRINITNNGYSNILIAISPDVPESNGSEIIENIKLMIRQASPVLYTATRNRTYFKEVNILIPDTWSQIDANSSSWETYENADVKIGSPNGVYGNTPYTLQIRGCGEPGEYIHLTPNYVLNLNKSENTIKYGPPGKVFVHEWSHLRYGVFDEHGIPGDSSYPLFYRQGPKIVPNVCTNLSPIAETIDITTNDSCTIDPVTGVYDKNCRFYFPEEFQPESSLMSYHNVDSVVHFCDDGQEYWHNRQAPNKHNTICDYQSVWTVITRHSDFANDNNPPNEIGHLEPSFKILRPNSGRYVLVADVSGSMTGQRIQRLEEAGRRWIKTDLPESCQVAIVQFSTTASVLSPLEKITDVNSRTRLMNRVPNSASGWTCIGCGLLEAEKILRPTGKGGVILLISDGDHNTGPSINDVLPQLLNSEIRIVTIALGKGADQQIENMADQTGGKNFFIPDTDTSNKINDALKGSLTYQPAATVEDVTVKVYETEYKAIDKTTDGTFVVDATIGRNVLFRVDYTGGTSIEKLILYSPSNVTYTNVTHDRTSKVAQIMIESAEMGEWKYLVSTKGNAGDTFVVRVTSQMNANVTAPITTRCWVDNGADIDNAAITPIRIFAQVKQGNNPVIGAIVKAYIQKPELEVDILDLYDSGSNADITQNDGIYSRFYSNVTTAGRYSMECQVWGDDSSRIQQGFIASSIAVNDQSDDYEVIKDQGTPTGIFRRIDFGGSFKVNKPVTKQDVYPPSRVTDMKVSRKNFTSKKRVKLQWTAPGGQLDTGKVADYQVKFSLNQTLLLNEHLWNEESPFLFNATFTQPLEILDAGKKQAATLFLRKPVLRTDYYIALRTINSAGKISPISNIATVKFNNDPLDNKSSRKKFEKQLKEIIKVLDVLP